MTLFETERLIVRRFTADDFDDFFALNGDPEVMRFIRPAKSFEDAKVFLDENILMYDQMPGLGRWAVHHKTTNEFVGTFAVIPFDDHKEPQIGYALLKKAWGKGYASELLRHGLKYVFSSLQLQKIFAVTDIANTDSQKVLEKSDFTLLKHQTEGAKTSSIFELQKPITISTERLLLFPLSYRQLVTYLKASNLFEQQAGLISNNRVVANDVKDLVETGILSKMATCNPGHQLFYTFWLVIDRKLNCIVAEVGFKGPPNEDASVEIGYGTMPAFTGQGYMTEAVQGLLQWACGRDDIKFVLAETDEKNIPSIRVVEKNAFNQFDKKNEMIWWRKSVQ